MEMTNQLSYLPPERYEVAPAKLQSGQIDIEAGKLVAKDPSDPLEAPTNSVVAVFDAIRRRGFALSVANLVSWNRYEKYMTTLFNHSTGK